MSGERSGREGRHLGAEWCTSRLDDLLPTILSVGDIVDESTAVKGEPFAVLDNRVPVEAVVAVVLDVGVVSSVVLQFSASL